MSKRRKHVKKSVKRKKSAKPVKKSTQKRVVKSTKKTSRKRSKKVQKTYKISWKTIKDKDLKRGDYKVIEINVKDYAFIDKSEAILSAAIKEFNYLYKRNVQPDGSIKYPKGIMVSFRIKKPNEPGHYWISYTSPPDFVPTPSNVKKFIAKKLLEYNSDYQDLIAEKYDEPIDPYQVTKISVRFLY